MDVATWSWCSAVVVTVIEGWQIDEHDEFVYYNEMPALPKDSINSIMLYD